MSEAVVTFRQVKSAIGSTERIRATLIGLGLVKMNQPVTRKRTDALMGMLRRVNHLVRIEE